MNIEILSIPLYKLHYIENVDDFTGLNQDEIESLLEDYDKDDINEIINALNWAKKNPKHDFRSISIEEIPHSDKDIYIYLCKLHESIQGLAK